MCVGVSFGTTIKLHKLPNMRNYHYGEMFLSILFNGFSHLISPLKKQTETPYYFSTYYHYWFGIKGFLNS